MILINIFALHFLSVYDSIYSKHIISNINNSVQIILYFRKSMLLNQSYNLKAGDFHKYHISHILLQKTGGANGKNNIIEVRLLFQTPASK